MIERKTILRLTAPAIFGISMSLSGCGASAVSQDLVDARQQVELARNGDAARLEPDELRAAERALMLAEAADDASADERHFAYLADRRARLAVVAADAETIRAAAENEQEDYQEDLERTALSQREALERRDDSLAAMRRELTDVRGELDERGETLDDRTTELRAREAELDQRIEELMQERAARAAAEQRAATAMAELRELAQVREEQGQWVITLNGEVLFETGEATLRETAERRLQAVASALVERTDSSIVIEGHTDSRGSDELNETLSRERAQAVRDFLSRRGVPAERMRAVGRGEDEPVADNSSPEGRANNRRVEIIVQRNG